MKKHLFVLFLVNCIFSLFASDFENKFMNVRWVRDYYNEVILARDRNIILSYVQKYKETPSVFHYELDSEVYWYEEEVLDKCEYDFSKVFDTYYLVVFFAGFDIIDIQKINKNMYQVVIEADSFSKEGFEKSLKSGCNWQKENIIIEKFYLKFDGDYLYIYLNERTNLLATYCAYDESEYQALVEAIKTNDFDNMEFTFPRHADGTCDYDERAWKSAKKPSSGTSLRTGKATTVKENLRVHSFDWATSPVCITLAAGTPVEILGVGDEETIDGITSRWVHVKVAPGTKGTDGTYIKWGNVLGWCFGGVVSDIEEVSESANALMSKTAEPAEMAALPESAVSKPAPAIEKTATVTENLRLRTDDKTAAQVVTTLAAGTRVKLFAPGREDTIDGIASNWVQVSVLDGAKDKDGNAIEAETIGWLFGGYLSKTEAAESECPNEEASAAKEPSALPIVPIAAGVAALAILLAAILLAAKKRKSCKE